jgi:hypothetical protein
MPMSTKQFIELTPHIQHYILHSVTIQENDNQLSVALAGRTGLLSFGFVLFHSILPLSELGINKNGVHTVYYTNYYSIEKMATCPNIRRVFFHYPAYMCKGLKTVPSVEQVIVYNSSNVQREFLVATFRQTFVNAHIISARLDCKYIYDPFGVFFSKDKTRLEEYEKYNCA